MRSSLALRFSLALQVSLLALAASLSGAFAPAVLAVDDFLGGSGGLVGGLAVRSDLEPAAFGRSANVSPTAAASNVTRQSLGRQSIPARDRSLTYRSSDLFALSKAAVPLLVADLEPKQASVARPMSGHSVGARPTAAWTRSVPTSMSFLSEATPPAAALRW
jgi:hypothetical protein